MNYMNYTYTMPVIPSGDMGKFSARLYPGSMSSGIKGI